MQFRVGVTVAVAGAGIVQVVVMMVVAGMAMFVAVLMAMAVAVLVGVAVHGAVGVGVLMVVDVEMVVVMGVGMAVIVGMLVSMLMLVAFDLGFTLAAAADGTHSQTPENYSTNKSFTRISVPPVACT